MTTSDELQTWVGRQEIADDILTPRRYASAAATLDKDMKWPEPGTPLPPAWYWIYFTPLMPTSTLADDGHEALGRFLPPVDLPRRMWAGGRIEFLAPLLVGEASQRVSTVKTITEKQGKSGRLVFVLVEHRILSGDRLCVREEQDIVYREAPRQGAVAPEPPVAPSAADFSQTISPTPNLLFRYSALTFNTHKIHLDRDYCRGVEGYPGLVVHGPLLATLLLELVRDNLPDAQVARFSFRAVSPLFDTGDFTVNGRRIGENKVELWAANHDGGLATSAEVELA
ncbi:MAG: MaoC family dehydratase N-terminal domain-containing protein [Alphaproteobacteria bacterium]|nr:MaoC family dehydratase N-terminal domain-containing protein [Alphaproteobacteria bacterium]